MLSQVIPEVIACADNGYDFSKFAGAVEFSHPLVRFLEGCTK